MYLCVELVDGRSAGQKQIPWAWRLYFVANEIKHAHQIESTNDQSNNLPKQRSTETIQISLNPDAMSDRHAPRFSMFGTNRDIKSFSLTVQRVEDERAPQRCTTWGIVSYTAELDFRNETTEDVFGCNMWLSPHNFDDLRQAARHGTD